MFELNPDFDAATGAVTTGNGRAETYAVDGAMDKDGPSGNSDSPGADAGSGTAADDTTSTGGPGGGTGPESGDCPLVDSFDGTELGSWWSTTGDGSSVLETGAVVLRAPAGTVTGLGTPLDGLEGFELQFEIRALPDDPGGQLQVGALGTTTLLMTIRQGSVTATAQTANGSASLSLEGPFNDVRFTAANGSVAIEVSDDGANFHGVGSFDSLDLDGFFTIFVELTSSSSSEAEARIDEVSVCPL